MTKPDRFSTLEIPELPKRTPTPAGYTIEDLMSIREAPRIELLEDSEHVQLTVAYASTNSASTPILFIDVLTHFHREQLEHYALEKYSQLGDTGDDVWHAVTIDIPKGLTSMVGILNIPNTCLDNGKLPGADREAYRNLRETAEPAWTSGEILSIGTKREGTLTNRTARFNPLYDAGNQATAPYPVAESRPLLHQTQMEVAQGLTLNTWLYLPPDREIKDVLLVTDGEVHAEEVPLLNLYQPHDSAIVYFSPEEASLRGDFLGNIELVASSLKNHVLPWAKTLAEQKGKVWPVGASDYIIAGGSLGGYAAAGIVLIHPEIALHAIVQSAALWWPDRQYWLLESWQEHIDAPDGIKRAIFHEYGRYDIRLSQENVELANVLSQADNVTSTSREYNGGHNYLSWRQGLIEGHNWILNNRPQG